MSLFESTLLNYANPFRNWTFRRFGRVAEKKERKGTNTKSGSRYDLNTGPRIVAPLNYRLSYGVRRQNPNFNPYELSNLLFIQPFSFLDEYVYRHAVLLVVFLGINRGQL